MGSISAALSSPSSVPTRLVSEPRLIRKQLYVTSFYNLQLHLGALVLFSLNLCPRILKILY